MGLEELKLKIKQTGYINNIKIGNYFHMKYPTIYSEVIKITSCLENSFYDNTLFRARIIFILKYNLDINKIKNDKGWFRFNRKKDDFFEKNIDYVKKGWEKSKSNSTNEFLSLDETIKILRTNDYYKNYIGRSKNRTLIKENIKLYHSIYHHTKFMDLFNKNSNKFSMRILFLVNKNGDINEIKCKNCNVNFTSFNYGINDYNKNCRVCFLNSVHHYPSKGYFKRKYGLEWEKYYNEDREKISKLKVNSQKWFIKKFGNEFGLIKYSEYLTKRIEILEKVKTKKYSKISQKLFWMIYENLNSEEKEYCWFKELNKEFLVKVSENKFYFPDFLMKNKIIEYDGKYWHNEIDDNSRNLLYKENGFDVMSVNEDEFNKRYINDTIIERCLKFLRNEI
jgi:very-short-patch-repair endonuclease